HRCRSRAGRRVRHRGAQLRRRARSRLRGPGRPALPVRGDRLPGDLRRYRGDPARGRTARGERPTPGALRRRAGEREGRAGRGPGGPGPGHGAGCAGEPGGRERGGARHHPRRPGRADAPRGRGRAGQPGAGRAVGAGERAGRGRLRPPRADRCCAGRSGPGDRGPVGLAGGDRRLNRHPAPTCQTGAMTSSRPTAADRIWCDEAIRRVQADAHRSADTHLHQLPLPADWGIDVYLKDESVHPTGSLKHRLARSLFLYALANGWLREGSTVVEATSGNTAVAEAYFARMLDLPYVAVMPRRTSPEKIARIEAYGGRCHFVDAPPDIYPEAERIAAETGGHYLDQFTYAERATDWRGNNNIAESIFSQLEAERHPVPTWI